jgi:hypothetical protein
VEENLENPSGPAGTRKREGGVDCDLLYNKIKCKSFRQRNREGTNS